MQLSIACMSGCPPESLPANDAQAFSAVSNATLSGMVVDVSVELLSANALPKTKQQIIAYRYNNLFMKPPNSRMLSIPARSQDQDKRACMHSLRRTNQLVFQFYRNLLSANNN